MGIRVAISGCGNRSRTVWQRHVQNSHSFRLVGVQDINPQSLEQAVREGKINIDQTYIDLEEMIACTHPDVLIVCNVNSAHASAIEAGLNARCHVLVEKPFTTDLVQAVRLVELSKRKSVLLGVVQNWRTKSVGQALRLSIANGRIGQVSHIFFRYLRDRELSHLPDYLFEEDDPLLFAMSIHHFDLFRYILNQEIVRVEGHAFRPSWSRYKNPSSMQLWMETNRGVIISYIATFSSRNRDLPLESIQVEGEMGTLFNESDYCEPPLKLSRRDAGLVDLTADVDVRDCNGQYELADVALLNNFHAALARGESLISPSVDNLGTLAVVEAARLCYREARAIKPQQLLDEARKAVTDL